MGDYPKDYTDPDAAYPPAWREIHTGVDSKTVLQFAPEGWAFTAAVTEGKCIARSSSAPVSTTGTTTI